MSGNARRHTLAVLTIVALTSFTRRPGADPRIAGNAFRDNPDWTGRRRC